MAHGRSVERAQVHKATVDSADAVKVYEALACSDDESNERNMAIFEK